MTVYRAAGTSEGLPQWHRRAFEDDYYPRQLNDAYALIDLLREQVKQLSGTAPEAIARLGMTESVARVYAFIRGKNGVVATKGAIFAAMYGLRSGDEPMPKIIDIWISHIRKRLPADERIETVWGVGYRWCKVAAAAA